MTQDRDIKYVNKDFTDLRNQLIEYSKNYFPNTYNDFSPTSPGMMYIEMAAYVGDILSFYQDTQLQETYLQYAKDTSNLYNMAYMLGYRPKVTTVAEVELELTQIIPATVTGQPNWALAISINAGAQAVSNTGGQVKFYIDKDIDFNYSSSNDPTEILIEEFDNATQQAVSFSLTKKAKAFSGELKTVVEVVTGVERFKTIYITDSNIIGIQSIVDSEGNNWSEVPFLGQDTIFVDTQNINGPDSSKVPYVLSLQRVPRRFTTKFIDTGELQIQFGSGITGQSDEILTPDPTNVGLGAPQGISRIDYAYDPSNFMSTGTYGLAPASTVLTITYLVGGTATANVPANTITGIEGVGAQVFVNNPEPATGGRDGDTVEEVRQNAMRAYNEQGRAVTLQDYTVRALSIPSKYGTVGKVYIAQDQLTNTNITTDSIIDSNPLSLSMYTLSYDNNRRLITSTETLKKNLKTYLSQYMLLTDAINIKDAFIVNIAVNFEIILRPSYLGGDVILQCINILKEYFDIRKWNINQPIMIGDIYTTLDKVKGVQTVQKVEILNKTGQGTYSEYSYDLAGATRNNVVFPSYDPMIFELRYPDNDIKGRITTL